MNEISRGEISTVPSPILEKYEAIILQLPVEQNKLSRGCVQPETSQKPPAKLF